MFIKNDFLEFLRESRERKFLIFRPKIGNWNWRVVGILTKNKFI